MHIPMISSSLKKYHYKFQYYIDNIEELKEYINNIKTYKPPQNKPVYNIDNAFTPAFIDSFVENTAYHIMHMILIKLVS